jgi:signal transduction histidine kinase
MRRDRRGGERYLETLSEVLRWTQTVVFVAVAVWALARWRRRGDAQSGWLAATFASLGAVIVVARLVDGLPEALWVEAIQRAIIAVLVLFPYLLLRFLATFEPLPRRWTRAAGWAVGGLAVAALLLPDLPNAEPPSGPSRVYALLVALTWAVVMPLVAARFWRAGRGRPTVARRRLRLLGLAVLTLGAALVFSAVVQAEGPAAALVSQGLALTSAVLLLVGFMPPPALRRLWRYPEEEALHLAALGLMETTSEEEVADVLVPHLRRVVAAGGVALVHGGRVLKADGVHQDDLRRALAGEADDVRTAPLSQGAIHVWTDRYTPFVGEEEASLLDRLGLLADLALDRSALLASEREARASLELANADLESFVFSASHDLKSPLIAMLSYMDLLENEFGSDLGEEARWYLERMSANGRFMEALIRDLLELSRVGRTQTAPERVELGQLVDDVAIELREQHPHMDVVTGPLPTLLVNGVRVRQLLTNLIDNAATHGGDGTVTVTIDARPSHEEPGAVVVSVRDDGPGVPETYRELVFGVFERLGDDANAPGTGVGLAICRKIMESIGGRIWLADAPGGADFRLFFPPATVAVATIDPEEVPV